ncbi:MAG: hypothetical protein ACK4IX_09670 [Candidatus Sericytochromatia bacterium]
MLNRIIILSMILISSCVETKKDIISSPSIQSSIVASKPDNLLVSSVVPSNNPSPTPTVKIRPKVDEENSILILIDTHLLVDKFKVFMSTEEVNKYPRKVYVLKESYDNLDQTDLDKLNKEYPEYKIYDPNKDSLDMKNSEGDLGIKYIKKSPICNNMYFSYIYKENLEEADFSSLKNRLELNLKNEKSVKYLMNRYPELIKSDKITSELAPNPMYGFFLNTNKIEISKIYQNIKQYNVNSKDKINILKVSSLRSLMYQTIKYLFLVNDKDVVYNISDVRDIESTINSISDGSRKLYSDCKIDNDENLLDISIIPKQNT